MIPSNVIPSHLPNFHTLPTANCRRLAILNKMLFTVVFAFVMLSHASHASALLLLRSSSNPNVFLLAKRASSCFYIDPVYGDMEEIYDDVDCDFIEGWLHGIDHPALDNAVRTTRLLQQTRPLELLKHVGAYICITSDEEKGEKSKINCVCACTYIPIFFYSSLWETLPM